MISRMAGGMEDAMKTVLGLDRLEEMESVFKGKRIGLTIRGWIPVGR